MPHGHAAQLLICHEKLYETTKHSQPWLVAPGSRWRWCSLRAEQWCDLCEYAVCAIHANACHEFHARHTETA